MLSVLVSILARLATCVGFAFILGKTVDRITTKIGRFVVLFMLCVPLNFILNYVDVRTLGYHQMGWTGALITALLFATFGTFFPPQPRNSNTP
jgi:hypothetical protein